VLVQAGQEKNLLTQAAPGARDDVGNDLLVGVAEVRLPVDVINCGGDVKPFAHYGNNSLPHKRVKGNAALLRFEFSPTHDSDWFVKPRIVG